MFPAEESAPSRIDGERAAMPFRRVAEGTVVIGIARAEVLVFEEKLVMFICQTVFVYGGSSVL